MRKQPKKKVSSVGLSVSEQIPEVKMKKIKIELSKNINHLFSRSEQCSQALFKISDFGAEVELSEEDEKFIKKAFEDFQMAQKILHESLR